MSSQEFSLAYTDYANKILPEVGGSTIAAHGYDCNTKDYWQDGCTESRVGFDFSDYYRFRPEQAIPKSHNHVMFECQRIYREHGIVKNILDLMVDYTVSDITISHPQRNIQSLGRKWFNRVRGPQVSAQFALGLYLFGTNVIDTYRHKLTLRQRRQLKDAATAGLSTRFDVVKKQGTVPYKYVFLNPVMVMMLGGPLTQFMGGEPEFGIRVPFQIARLLEKTDKLTPEEKAVLESIPPETRDVIRKGDGYHYFKLDRPLDVYHYRKHDWQRWANPLLMAVYRDLRMLEQAQLADMAALDGAINQLMIVKLGSLEHDLVPTKAAFLRLKEALAANTGGGPRVITWGPDIEIEQSNVDIAQYLDSGKYEPIMERIYGGLGIPPSMTGSTSAAGSTNNLVSLRGFVERLVYGRNMLVDFWTRQLADFSREMGIKTPFELEFNIPNLGDVEAEKKLCIELYDRGVVSEEYLQSKFNVNTNLEKSRTVKEEKARKKGSMNRKAGPYNNPERPEECVKTLVEQGKLPLDELGIKSRVTNKPLTEGDALPTLPVDGGGDSDTFKQNRRSNNGRPKGAKDSVPRKQRNRSKPVLRASKIWAKAIQKDIADVINPILLEAEGKKNMRSLTASQSKTAEYLALGTLFNLRTDEFTREHILAAHAADYNEDAITEYRNIVRETETELDRSLTADEKRDIAAEVYSYMV